VSQLPGHTRVLACRVFEPELAALGVPPGRVAYLEQGLHRYPDDLRAEVAAALAGLENDPRVRRVVLAYGFCGGGLEGLASRRVELVIPRAHDCIPLLLGREPAGGQAFYLSPGWVDHGHTPLTEHRITAERFGEEDARWVARQMLKGYREVVLVRTAAGLEPRHRAYAREMAELCGLGLRETPGHPGRLQRVLAGDPGGPALVLPPGRPVEAGMFPQAGEPGRAACP
jgi:hypothetical protein